MIDDAFPDIGKMRELLRKIREAESLVHSLRNEAARFGPISELHKFWQSQKAVLFEETFTRHAYGWGKSDRAAAALRHMRMSTATRVGSLTR